MRNVYDPFNFYFCTFLERRHESLSKNMISNSLISVNEMKDKVRVKGVVALLLTEDAPAVLGFIFGCGWILLVFSIQLCQANGERDEHEQE